MFKGTNQNWQVNSANKLEINSDNGIAIAECSMSIMITGEEKLANAKLIAAAPDLLKSLELFILNIQRGKSISEDHLIFKDAIKAIKKATE